MTVRDVINTIKDNNLNHFGVDIDINYRSYLDTKDKQIDFLCGLATYDWDRHELISKDGDKYELSAQVAAYKINIYPVVTVSIWLKED